MLPLKIGVYIEILYKPSMLDNVINFIFFNDDQQMLHFMANLYAFKDVAIEEDEHNKASQEAYNAMKGNTMPKGVMSLENF